MLEYPREQDHTALFLRIWDTAYRISQIRLVPVSGQGRRVFSNQLATTDQAAKRLLWRGHSIEGIADGKALKVSDVGELPYPYVVKSVEVLATRPLSSNDLAALGQLEEVDVLLLRDVPIADSDVGYLTRLAELRTLDLRFTSISDKALAQLGCYEHLRSLNLSGTHVTDTGLEYLLELKQLEELDLSLTGISDQGVEHLRKLPALRDLSLVDTQVSDGALTHLLQLRSLKRVCLTSTQISASRVQELRKQLPDCKVETRERRTIDLLSLVDIGRDAVAGRWIFDAESLVSSDDPFARMQIPYSPPDEYRLRITAQRLSRENGTCFGLPIGDRQVTALVDNWPDLGGITGLDNVDGKQAYESESAVSTKVFESSEPVELSITVRSRGISVMADGRLLIDWRGDSRRLSVGGAWVVPDRRVLFVGSREGSFKFSKIELTPITGNGKVVTDLQTQ
jgi:hypothetical protein